MFSINQKSIIKKTVVPSNLQQVWWKWSTHEGLLTFFGPDNHIELRIGGPFEIYFLLDQPYGMRGGEGNIILSYIPRKMLSFTWNAPPDQAYVRNHEHKTWVVIHFDEVEDGTEVTLEHLGWLDGAEWDTAYQYFDRAWTTVLDWFVKSCES